MQVFSISQLASETRVNLETIRYYERRGLLPEPPRNAQGHRQYPPEFVRYIKFIKKAQTMGFSLTEITELVALKMNRHATCDDVRVLARKKCDEIALKISMLSEIREELMHLVETCPGGDSLLGECPIIEAFSR